MKKPLRLTPGDTVEIIAPASRCPDESLKQLKELLSSWQLNCVVADDIFGNDFLFANSDVARFQALKNALFNPEVKAIICARGGYGSMRLIPELAKLTPPPTPKLFVGMSDITALHTFFQQAWHWPVLHGVLMQDRFSPESIAAVKSILFGDIPRVEFDAVPMNNHAKNNIVIDSAVTGGNLCLLQNSIGTLWQVDTKNKIILLEEVHERGYRIDRMLEHLRQAGIFNQAAAIIYGDFLNGNEADGTSFVTPVLERFAQTCDIPVIKINDIGHGHTSLPIPLGTQARLTLGEQAKLVVNAP